MCSGSSGHKLNKHEWLTLNANRFRLFQHKGEPESNFDCLTKIWWLVFLISTTLFQATWPDSNRSTHKYGSWGFFLGPLPKDKQPGNIKLLHTVCLKLSFNPISQYDTSFRNKAATGIGIINAVPANNFSTQSTVGRSWPKAVKKSISCVVVERENQFNTLYFGQFLPTVQSLLTGRDSPPFFPRSYLIKF